MFKAFDTIDHNNLLDNLHYYGVHVAAIDWLTSYLTDKSEYIFIIGKKYLTLAPQVSSLEPRGIISSGRKGRVPQYFVWRRHQWQCPPNNKVNEAWLKGTQTCHVVRFVGVIQ